MQNIKGQMKIFHDKTVIVLYLIFNNANEISDFSFIT